MQTFTIYKVLCGLQSTSTSLSHFDLHNSTTRKVLQVCVEYTLGIIQRLWGHLSYFILVLAENLSQWCESIFSMSQGHFEFYFCLADQ